MSGTMTWVGLDVHARSTRAAPIDTMTGELVRMRFGGAVEAPLAWLGRAARPGQGLLKAGRRGLGCIARPSRPGIGMQVIAPGKTPRGPSDRVKTDRKEPSCGRGCCLAGSLTPVAAPPPVVEVARELTRAHDACRRPGAR